MIAVQKCFKELPISHYYYDDVVDKIVVFNFKHFLLTNSGRARFQNYQENETTKRADELFKLMNFSIWDCDEDSNSKRFF